MGGWEESRSINIKAYNSFNMFFLFAHNIPNTMTSYFNYCFYTEISCFTQSKQKSIFLYWQLVLFPAGKASA